MINQFLVIIGAMSIYKDFMSVERLHSMFSGETGYHEVFNQELANLMSTPCVSDQIPAQTKVLFLKDWKDFDPTAKDTLHVLFNIEGGHALYDNGDVLNDPQKALDNLQSFLEKKFLTLYLTPTHLTPNSYINQAYGNKILSKAQLLPHGFGITGLGKQLLDSAINSGLLIDVKHMSLMSRLMFYEYRRSRYPGLKIIASHAGFTSLALSEFNTWFPGQLVMGDVVRVSGTKRKGHFDSTAFYPLSINLYNVDIYEILKSGGMIGISMDVRILGGKETTDALQHDYISLKEYNVLSLPENERDAKIKEIATDLLNGIAPAFSPSANRHIPESGELSHEMGEGIAEFLPKTTVRREELSRQATQHVRLVANHLLHLKKVADMWGLPIPWGQVCIGSDFDGLIEAVDCCKNATDYKDLAALLTPELINGAHASGIKLEMDPEEIVESFCYTNAINFLNDHFRL